jgi:hypothetical protein
MNPMDTQMMMANFLRSLPPANSPQQQPEVPINFTGPPSSWMQQLVIGLGKQPQPQPQPQDQSMLAG